MFKVIALTLIYLTVNTDGAKILGFFPTPSISHQVVFRVLMHELAKRGHEVYVVTTDPAFPKGKAPKNLTEIDIHDISYLKWREAVLSPEMTTGNKNDMKQQIAVMYAIIINLFDEQINTDAVQKLLNDKSLKFDLIFLESFVRPGLILSDYYKAPIILITSFLPIYNNMEVLGSPVHPILYPLGVCRQKVNNLSAWEKITELYSYYNVLNYVDSYDDRVNAIIKKNFGPDAPSVYELQNNVDMLFVNVHPIWDMNRPAPPNVIYLGGLHRNPEKDLPKDLKNFLDSSEHGVIYVSFGTNIDPSLLPQEKIKMLANVLSRTPYDVIWKWDKDDFPNRPKNIKIFKWLPQSDLLSHPKVLLFVTQGGLQSTDEAIAAGVPLIGLPMLVDQWFNVEQYERLKIGLGLQMEELTEEKFKNALDTVLNDKSYRNNIIKLRTLMADQPQTPLQRAVWWTEHVLRHGSGKHLRSPAANMSWKEYLELELVGYVLLTILTLIIISVFIFVYLYKFITVSHISDEHLKKIN
ncbi:UDP-glycosyltransferase UGT4-like [Galleria mellonella]|uniref:UDP-glucuronosyltransferase n=1 Tax=Galleria mellonella TaxID=7137 RepID=A0A6J3C354_GALME|nr:UDP-glycosyltransferase UGT4-like [Galleria mellonella]